MAKFDKPTLEEYRIIGIAEVIYNPSYEMLFEEETKEGLEGFEEGQETELGVVCVQASVYTDRSPKDKFIVDNVNSCDTVWWTLDEYKNDNRRMTEDVWKVTSEPTKKEPSSEHLFVADGFCGVSKDIRMKIRLIVKVAWQAYFVTNMFIRPVNQRELGQRPDFTVRNASKTKVKNYEELGLNSETYIVFNVMTREQVILNIWYGGEAKKGMFSMTDCYLPLRGITLVHCSTDTDMNGRNTTTLLGLSGTGKTTLSTDPKRLLIGDDEHGWDDKGTFNFGGGYCARVIDFDKESEPDTYNTIRRNALLENVIVDENGKIDFIDKSRTENTRVFYPIYHIKNIAKPISAGPTAEQVIFLSADTSSVLLPVSILNGEQTRYYFLSDFTARLAGTERNITEPAPTFSVRFSQTFLELHPTKYVEELVRKMKENGTKAYLVNTDWSDTGKHISTRDTRGIIDTVLNHPIDEAPIKTTPYFDFVVLTKLEGAATEILDPRDTYRDVSQWDEKAKDLTVRFQKNSVKYTTNEADKALIAAGPQL